MDGTVSGRASEPAWTTNPSGVSVLRWPSSLLASEARWLLSPRSLGRPDWPDLVGHVLQEAFVGPEVRQVFSRAYADSSGSVLLGDDSEDLDGPEFLKRWRKRPTAFRRASDARTGLSAVEGLRRHSTSADDLSVWWRTWEPTATLSRSFRRAVSTRGSLHSSSRRLSSSRGWGNPARGPWDSDTSKKLETLARRHLRRGDRGDPRPCLSVPASVVPRHSDSGDCGWHWP